METVRCTLFWIMRIEYVRKWSMRHGFVDLWCQWTVQHYGRNSVLEYRKLFFCSSLFSSLQNSDKKFNLSAPQFFISTVTGMSVINKIISLFLNKNLSAYYVTGTVLDTVDSVMTKMLPLRSRKKCKMTWHLFTYLSTSWILYVCHVFCSSQEL